MPEKVETKRVCVYVTVDAYTKLKYMAAAERTSMTGEVERMIQEKAAADFPELSPEK